MVRATLRDIAVRDFRSLAEETQRQARRQLNKLARHPECGDELGHRMGVNLTGYRAVHFARNRYRIVYRWLPSEGEVEVWGIGKREKEGGIYRMVGKRVDAADE